MNPNCIKKRISTSGNTAVSFSIFPRSTIVSIVLMLGTQTVFGQGYWAPSSMRIQTPRGPATITTQHYVHTPYYATRSISQKYYFTIVLNSLGKDSTLEASAKIDISEKLHLLKFRKSGKKVELRPDETLEIYRTTSKGEQISGIPADSCWLFKCVTGAINGYSSVAEKGYSYIVAIQFGEGKIVSLSPERLEPIIQGHAKAMKYFEKRKYVKAIEAFNKE